MLALLFLGHCLGSLVTINIQNGLNSYTGGTSVAISTYGGLGTPGQYNDNGNTFADDYHWCLGNHLFEGGSTYYDQKILARFTSLSGALASVQGQKLVAANVTLYAHAGGSSGVFLKFLYPAVAWNDSVPVTCAGCHVAIGWRYYNRGAGDTGAWAGIGATGASDTLSGLQSISLNTIPQSACSGSSAAPVVFALDIGMVERWIAGCENNGVLLVNGVNTTHVGVVPNQETSNPSQRPKLTLVFDSAQLAPVPNCSVVPGSPTTTPGSSNTPSSAPSLAPSAAPSEPGELTDRGTGTALGVGWAVVGLLAAISA